MNLNSRMTNNLGIVVHRLDLLILTHDLPSTSRLILTHDLPSTSRLSVLCSRLQRETSDSCQVLTFNNSSSSSDQIVHKHFSQWTMETIQFCRRLHIPAVNKRHARSLTKMIFVGSRRFYNFPLIFFSSAFELCSTSGTENLETTDQRISVVQTWVRLSVYVEA
jgi:hypothetical protein